MNEGLITRRYAKALLEYAAASGEDKDVYGRMKSLQNQLLVLPPLREALQSPVVSLEDKMQLMLTASGGGEFENSIKRFIKLVLRNDRGRLMQNIALSYMQLYRLANNITVVQLITVFPLSVDTLERIRHEVGLRTRGEVELETFVDPSIEGGLIFQIDDLRLDASVAGQLEKIRRQFIQKNRIIV